MHCIGNHCDRVEEDRVVNMWVHRVTMMYFCSISMPVDFCCRLLGKKTLRNVRHCDSTRIRFVRKSVIIWTFS